MEGMVRKCTLHTISSPFGKEFHVRSPAPNLGRRAAWVAALVIPCTLVLIGLSDNTNVWWRYSGMNVLKGAT